MSRSWSALGHRESGPVLVPFSGSEHDWAAVELGAWLARGRGRVLQLAGASTGHRGARRQPAACERVARRPAGARYRRRAGDRRALAARPSWRSRASAGVVVVGLTGSLADHGSGTNPHRAGGRARGDDGSRAPWAATGRPGSARRRHAFHLDDRRVITSPTEAASRAGKLRPPPWTRSSPARARRATGRPPAPVCTARSSGRPEADSGPRRTRLVETTAWRLASIRTGTPSSVVSQAREPGAQPATTVREIAVHLLERLQHAPRRRCGTPSRPRRAARRRRAGIRPGVVAQVRPHLRRALRRAA